MTYLEFTSMAVEYRHGIFLGTSETEFNRMAGARLGPGQLFKDDAGYGPGSSIYVVDEPLAGTRRSTGIQQVFLFDGGELAYIANQIQNAHGTSSLPRNEADAVLADYRRYMCWRFGAISTRSTMGPKLRSAIIGPAQIYDQAGATDGRVSMDAFIVEDIGKPEGQVGVIIVTRLSRFGQD